MGRLSLSVAMGMALSLNAGAANAQSVNLGGQTATQLDFFEAESVAEFNKPWSLAVLPDGRLLVAEEPGHLFLLGRSDRKIEVANVPSVDTSRDDGLLDITPSPDFAENETIFFTYIDPADGGRLALARASLSSSEHKAALVDVEVVWRQEKNGRVRHDWRRPCFRSAG